jgi:hypothetical protein
MNRLWLLPVVVLVLAVGCSSPQQTDNLDAIAATTELAGQGMISSPVASNADTDPNHLLGRPNGYTSRTTFLVDGVTTIDGDTQSCARGGCVEGWPDGSSAQKRSDYIQQIASSAPAFAEYDYARPDGLLLRVSRYVDPEQAQKLADAFMAL